MLVAVYGSLKRDYFNHHVLAGAEFVSSWQTPPEYTLLDLGGFPGVVVEGKTAVHTEIYRVNGAILARLDELEGHPTFYRRTTLTSPFGETYFYLYQRSSGDERVLSSGNWEDNAGVVTQSSAAGRLKYHCRRCDSTTEVILRSITEEISCHCGETMERMRP